MPRILHLVHVFPPESHGGTEMYVQALARAQRAQGLDAVVACGSERYQGAEPAREEQEGLPVFRLPMNGHLRDADWSCSETTAQLRAVMAESRPDLVHVHHWHNLSTDVVRAAAATGVPVVVTLSDFFSCCPLFFRLPDDVTPCPPDLDPEVCVRCLASAYVAPEPMVRAAFPRRETQLREELAAAGAVTVLSRAQLDYMRAMPIFDGVPLQVLSYPSPVLGEPAAAASPRTGDVDLRLVSWGGLVPGKGFGVLVEACERLRAPDRIELHHFGTVLDEDYRDRVIALGPRSKPTLHGRFGREELMTLFPSYDLAVFPSFYMETHGLVVDEAIQLGLPVIVSDRGAPPERVGAHGLTFPAGDVGALADALQRIIDDSTVLETFRNAPLPAPYSMERHLDDLDEVYRAVSGAGRTGG